MWRGLGVAQVGRVAAARHRAALAGEVVAGRAVGQEDLATAGDRLVALLLGEAGQAVVGRVGDRRARAPGWRRTPRGRRSRRACRPRAWSGSAAPGWAIGIRPVPTWKSTAAAPTPARDGPSWLPLTVETPSPFWPWQNAQPTRKSLRPSATSSSSLAAEPAVDEGANAAYRLPVSTRPSSSSSSAGDRDGGGGRESRAGGAVQDAAETAATCTGGPHRARCHLMR